MREVWQIFNDLMKKKKNISTISVKEIIVNNRQYRLVENNFPRRINSEYWKKKSNIHSYFKLSVLG